MEPDILFNPTHQTQCHRLCCWRRQIQAGASTSRGWVSITSVDWREHMAKFSLWPSSVWYNTDPCLGIRVNHTTMVWLRRIQKRLTQNRWLQTATVPKMGGQSSYSPRRLVSVLFELPKPPQRWFLKQYGYEPRG